MATTYAEIYNLALKRIPARFLSKLSVEGRESLLSGWLSCAEADFAPVCKLDFISNKDGTNQQYTIDLDYESIDILSQGIAVRIAYYVCGDDEQFRNKMSTKEYSFFSPANLLTATLSFCKELDAEYKDKIIQYSYRHGSISSLSV